MTVSCHGKRIKRHSTAGNVIHPQEILIVLKSGNSVYQLVQRTKENLYYYCTGVNNVFIEEFMMT